MAKRHNMTTVTTTAGALEGTQFPGWVIRNIGNNTIAYLGDSDVTATTGFPLEPQAVFTPHDMSHKQLTGKLAERLYAITASGTVDVVVLIAGKVQG